MIEVDLINSEKKKGHILGKLSSFIFVVIILIMMKPFNENYKYVIVILVVVSLIGIALGVNLYKIYMKFLAGTGDQINIQIDEKLINLSLYDSESKSIEENLQIIVGANIKENEKQFILSRLNDLSKEIVDGIWFNFKNNISSIILSFFSTLLALFSACLTIYLKNSLKNNKIMKNSNIIIKILAQQYLTLFIVFIIIITLVGFIEFYKFKISIKERKKKTNLDKIISIYKMMLNYKVE